MSSESSSVTNLKKQIDEIAEINVESSQNVSDLIADINLLSPKSNSSNLSPNESDDHLLDFLDDSGLCNETPRSHKFDNSISTPVGSSFALSSSNSNANSPMSANYDHESDINSFLSAFNTKYDLAACSLFDVLDLIDSLLANSTKQQKKNDEELRKKPKNEDIISSCNINSIKSENNALKIKLDEATNSMKEAQHLIQTLEQQVSNLNSTNSFLQKSNESLQNDIMNLQKSLNSIHSLMENQLDDLSVLGTQRSELIDITKKQDLIIQQYDHVNKSIQQSMQQQIQINQAKQDKPLISDDKHQIKKRTEDELYTLMCSLIRTIDDSQFSNELSDSVHIIRDNSQLQLNERIISIFNDLIEFTSGKCAKFDQLNKENTRAVKSQAMIKQKCLEILTLFEEQLKFLQNLSRSTDLQSIVFNTGSKSQTPLITEDIKAELIRQCAALGSFVEETIGVISLEKFEESFEVPEGVESTHIFDLLRPSQSTDVLSNLFENFDKENIEARKLYDLFSAQLFINNLLKNHTNELLMRISHCGREIANLRQELEDQATDTEQIETMKKLIKHFRHKDNKLRRYLSKYINISEETPTNDIVIAILEGYEVNDKKSKKDSPPLIQENKQLKEELNRCQKELNEYKQMLVNNQTQQSEELSAQVKLLQSKLEECQANCKQFKSQLNSSNQELVSLRNENSEKDQKIEEFSRQIESTERSHQNALKEANERIDFTVAENKKLKQQINNFESTMVKVKKNRQQLGHEIDRLKKINMQLTESLDSQHTKMKSEYCSTIRDLTETNEKLAREISNLQSQVQILTAKNQQLTSENATLSIAKKSADLKLRSIDEKISLEKKNLQSQISAQVTASQVEQSKKLNEMNQLIDNAVERLSSLSYSSEPLSSNNQNNEGSSMGRGFNLIHVVSTVEEEFNRARKTQSLYVDLLEKVKEVEKLLNIQSPDRLVSEIQSLLSEQSKNYNVLSENEKKVKNDRLELERLKRESKKCESQIIQLKQWENWARRIHRIIHEAEYAHLDSDQLRQALEEALLASVSSRSISFRLDSLRIQKNIILRFDKRFLNGHHNIRPSICPIIAICLCIRRMQKCAGCLPLSITNTDTKLNISLKKKYNRKIDLNFDDDDDVDIDIDSDHRPSLNLKKSQNTRKDRETPRKKKSSSKHNQKEKNSCKSPLRPLIPMFV